MDEVVLHGERVFLRPLREGDEDQIVDYADYEENWMWTLVQLYPYYKENAQEFVSRSIRGWNDGSDHILGVVLKEHGRLIGAIDIRVQDSYHRCAEIGYMISYPYWGRGLGMEAVMIGLGYAFDNLKLHRVQAAIFEQNGRSAGILKGCGFVREGIERERYFRNGQWMDGIMYSLLAEEYDRHVKGVSLKTV